MVDRPDDVPSIEEVENTDDLPDWWAQDTTITVSRFVKQSLDAQREGRPWGIFLEKLRREHADPLTVNDVDELAKVLKNNLAGAQESEDGDAEELGTKLDKVISMVEQTRDNTEGIQNELRR